MPLFDQFKDKQWIAWLDVTSFGVFPTGCNDRRQANSLIDSHSSEIVNHWRANWGPDSLKIDDSCAQKKSKFPYVKIVLWQRDISVNFRRRNRWIESENAHEITTREKV